MQKTGFKAMDARPVTFIIMKLGYTSQGMYRSKRFRIPGSRNASKEVLAYNVYCKKATENIEMFKQTSFRIEFRFLFSLSHVQSIAFEYFRQLILWQPGIHSATLPFVLTRKVFHGNWYDQGVHLVHVCD